MIISWKSPTTTFTIGVFIGTAIFLFGSRNNQSATVRRNLIRYMTQALNETRYIPAPISQTFMVSEQEEEEQFNKDLEIKLSMQTEVPPNISAVRVLCFIITTPKNHWVRAIHVKRTWGRRCNKLIFMSTKDDPLLGAVKLDVKEGYDYLWSKTKTSMKYIYDNYVDQYDWFLKADDDTYVIMENLRNLLKDYDCDEGHYFGCNFQPYYTLSYMSGGAGYVLSRRAVHKFVEEALPDPKKCSPKDVGYEDVEMGKCLSKVGIFADDSRDEFKKHRFLALPPKHYLLPGALPKDFWWWQYIRYPQKPGLKDCCSHTGISFHYITPNDMYLFEFFLYQLQVVGFNKSDSLQTSSTTTTEATTELIFIKETSAPEEDLEESSSFPTIDEEDEMDTALSEDVDAFTRKNINSKEYEESPSTNSPVKLKHSIRKNTKNRKKFNWKERVLERNRMHRNPELLDE